MARKKYVPEPDQNISLQIAPMVNLMFVLLAAFTITAGQKIVEAELGVKVPGQAKATSAQENVAAPPVTLGITRNKTIVFNGNPIGDPDDKDLQQLRAQLTRLVEIYNDQSVIIRPSDQTPHERVIDVLNACSAAKVSKLSFGG